MVAAKCWRPVGCGQGAEDSWQSECGFLLPLWSRSLLRALEEASLLSDSLLPGGKRCGAGIRKLPSCADCPACDSEVSCKSLVRLKGASRLVCGLMVSV